MATLDSKNVAENDLNIAESNPIVPAGNMQWGQLVEIDQGYLSASKTTKFWHSVLFQMILFGA